MSTTAIRLTDPYLIREIEKEQRVRQDNNPTKTAARLLTERLAQLEVKRDESHSAPSTRRRRAS